MIHATGTLWVPLEEFWPELERVVRKTVELSEREDVYFHTPSLTFFMRDAEYRLAGKVIDESMLSMELDAVDTTHAVPFEVDLDWLRELFDRFALAADNISFSYGRPRIDNYDVIVDFVANSDDPVATSDYPRIIAPQWNASVEDAPAPMAGASS